MDKILLMDLANLVERMERCSETSKIDASGYMEGSYIKGAFEGMTIGIDLVLNGLKIVLEENSDD